MMENLAGIQVYREVHGVTVWCDPSFSGRYMGFKIALGVGGSANRCLAFASFIYQLVSQSRPTARRKMQPR